MQSRWTNATYAVPFSGHQSEAADSPRVHSTTHPAPTSLAGLWIGRFDIILPWRVPGRANAGTVGGTILLSDSTANPGMPDSGRRMHRGEFLIDFHTFGFRPESRGVIGWRIGKDSVRILLNPAIDRGLIHLAGEVAGDRIRGRWTRVGDSRGAIGTFVLTRGEPELQNTRQRIEAEPTSR